MIVFTRKRAASGAKTLTITEEAYQLLKRERKGRESFSEVIRPLVMDRGNLRDSYGAWTMSDEEKARIFSGLRLNWKKTSERIRGLRIQS